jgi:inner membrane protein
MITDYLTGLAPHWLWLIAGMAMVVTELIAPGFFLIWLGAAALFTGLLSLLLPIPIVTQFVLFSLVSIILVFAARRWFKQNPIESHDPKLNDRGARLIGQIVTVVDQVDAGSGRVRVGDSIWSARGAVATAGEHVRITGTDGTVLIVEVAKNGLAD